MSQETSKYAFFNGKIVPIDQAKVSVMTHAFNYGTAVFGGMRGYWNEDERQLFIFRPHEHFERLTHSAGLLRIKIPHSIDELTDILAELFRTEGFEQNCYARPIAYKSTEMIGVRLSDIDDGFTIFAMPFERYVSNEEGSHVHFSAWRRIDDNAIPARGKVTGAYVNSALIKADALLAGYDEALVLNNDGHVSEASAANVFVIRKGVLYTPPVQSNVLEGVVRRSVIELAREELGLEVIERDIDRTEVYMADEVFLCGTGVQIAAVTRVEHRDIGSGQLGPITRDLRGLFFDVVSGRVDKYRHWVSPVYASEKIKA